MARQTSGVVGEIIELQTPNDTDCIPATKQGLYEDIRENLGVQFPSSQNDTFVSVSISPPSDTQKLWLQVERAGNPIALWKYVRGKWIRIFGFGLPFVVELVGDPNNPLEGYQPLTDTRSSWIQLPDGDFVYKAIFVGN